MVPQPPYRMKRPDSSAGGPDAVLIAVGELPPESKPEPRASVIPPERVKEVHRLSVEALKKLNEFRDASDLGATPRELRRAGRPVADIQEELQEAVRAGREERVSLPTAEKEIDLSTEAKDGINIGEQERARLQNATETPVETPGEANEPITEVSEDELVPLPVSPQPESTPPSAAPVEAESMVEAHELVDTEPAVDDVVAGKGRVDGYDAAGKATFEQPQPQPKEGPITKPVAKVVLPFAAAPSASAVRQEEPAVRGAPTSEKPKGVGDEAIEKSSVKETLPAWESTPSADLEREPEVKSFKTSMGSVYTRMPDGRYQRLKVANTPDRGLKEPEEFTLFISDAKNEVADAVYQGDVGEQEMNEKAFVVENMPGDQPIIRHKRSEVVNPDNLYVAIVRGMGTPQVKYTRRFAASFTPKPGKTVFEYTGADGGRMRTRHVGHEVTEIEYDVGAQTPETKPEPKKEALPASPQKVETKAPPAEAPKAAEAPRSTTFETPKGVSHARALVEAELIRAKSEGAVVHGPFCPKERCNDGRLSRKGRDDPGEPFEKEI